MFQKIGGFAAAAAITFAAHCSPAMAADGDDAMFGLQWGMTVAQIEKAGVTLDKKSVSNNLSTYAAKSLPKNLGNAEQYNLVFADGKLAKIVYIGDSFTNDHYGIDGKKAFSELKDSLAEKYQASTIDRQVVGLRLYKDSNEFYECLRYPGCGMWAASFKDDSKIIVLMMEGERAGRGFIKLVAEATPQWSEALDKHRSQKRATNKDAL